MAACFIAIFLFEGNAGISDVGERESLRQVGRSELLWMLPKGDEKVGSQITTSRGSMRSRHILLVTDRS